MAHIHQYSNRGNKKILKQITLLFSIGIFFAGFMMTTSKDLNTEWKLIVVISVLVILLFMIISYKTNPLAWIRIFKKTKFDSIVRSTDKITEILKKLDDRCFAFNWLIMEFFQIDHLVITPYGIFVVAAIENGDAFTIKNNVLMYGNKPFRKLTSKLWRISHMINIIFKKGFKFEIMPVPVIVSTESKTVSIKEFQGIHIVPCCRLNELIESREESLDVKMVEGFSWFVSQRYILKH